MQEKRVIAEHVRLTEKAAEQTFNAQLRKLSRAGSSTPDAQSQDTTATLSVAIVGRPNVGKSALFNRLVGRKIAIVHDQPGITRDRISATVTRGVRPFTLWDTGGVLGTGESELTAQVRRGAEEAIRDSDVLLFVVDAKAGLSPIDKEFGRLLRKSNKPVVLVVNKIDNEKHEALAAEFDALGFEHGASVSAEHNRGIDPLLDTIDELLPAAVAIHDSRFTIHDSLRVAIVGRPNVGKSSLINAIVKRERAIVSELAGTTRDAVDISYERDSEYFVFIDTAGIRKRGKHSTSVEVFSVMRAERSIRRADLCVLIVDLTSGVTAQDKKIAGLIQESRKPVIVVANKFDLVRSKNLTGLTGQVRNRRGLNLIEEIVAAARERLFFLDYAPVLVASAMTGEHVEKLFRLIKKIRHAAEARIGTGVLNRLLRTAFDANPPPMIKGRRLKLFYATQPRRALATTGLSGGRPDRPLIPPEFVLFVNEPALLSQTYGRYLEGRIREVEPYPGLPVGLKLRSRNDKLSQNSSQLKRRRS
jgi:GTP-binding protein